MAPSSHRPHPVVAGKSSPNPKTPDRNGNLRRSFSGNPFAEKPSATAAHSRSFNAATPASSPSAFGQRNEITVSSRDYEQKENELYTKSSVSVKSPAVSKGSRNFMSPTISAASKFTPSPRKKTLTERNGEVRTSISSSDGNPNTLTDFLDLDWPPAMSVEPKKIKSPCTSKVSESELKEADPKVRLSALEFSELNMEIGGDKENVLEEKETSRSSLSKSKFTHSPRKKTLTERNGELRTSISSSDGNPNMLQDFLDLDWPPAMSVEPKKIKASCNSKVVESELKEADPKVRLNPLEFSELNMEVGGDEENVLEERETSRSSLSKSVPEFSKSFDSEHSLPPYDPKTNYLSPRPRFLLYKPNSRISALLNKEREAASEERRRLEDHISSECFVESPNSEDIESENSLDEYEDVVSSVEFVQDGNIHLPTEVSESEPITKTDHHPAGEVQSIKTHLVEDVVSSVEFVQDGNIRLPTEVPESEPITATDHHPAGEVRSVKTHLVDSSMEAKHVPRVLFLARSRSIPLLLIFLIACLSFSVTDSPVIHEHPHSFPKPEQTSDISKFIKTKLDGLTRTWLWSPFWPAHTKLFGSLAEVNNHDPLSHRNLTYLDTEKRIYDFFEENREEFGRQIDDEEGPYEEEQQVLQIIQPDSYMGKHGGSDEQQYSWIVDVAELGGDDWVAPLLPPLESSDVQDEHEASEHGDLTAEDFEKNAEDFGRRIDVEEGASEVQQFTQIIEDGDLTASSEHLDTEKGTDEDFAKNAEFLLGGHGVSREDDPKDTVKDAEEIGVVEGKQGLESVEANKETCAAPPNSVDFFFHELICKHQSLEHGDEDGSDSPAQMDPAEDDLSSASVDLHDASSQGFQLFVAALLLVLFVPIAAIAIRARRTSTGRPQAIGGEPCPSDTCSFSGSSYNRRRSRRAGEVIPGAEKLRRESMASSTGSPSYGSFTTYEKVACKHGEEEVMTPVRRSSRIRSHVTSP